MDKTSRALERMARTAGDLAAAIGGHGEGVLGRRPSADAWAAKEIVCHLRDVEEFYFIRIETILLNEEPRLILLDPDRWAEERQYLLNDATAALAAFRLRREETLRFVSGLAPDQWDRGGIHPIRGRVTVRNIVHSMAKHDDNHLDQLARALAGLP